MNQNVAMIATRRDHKCGERASSSSTARSRCLEMRADDEVSRGIDEIPVVDVPRHVLEIALVDALPLGLRAASKLLDENEQRDEPLLVQRRAQQHEHRREGHGAQLARDDSQSRHANAEETVAVPIVARRCFEEPLRWARDTRVRERSHLARIAAIVGDSAALWRASAAAAAGPF